MPRTLSVADIRAPLQLQNRLAFHRQLFSAKHIDEDDLDYLSRHPDSTITYCPVCRQPYFRKDKHQKVSRKCSIREQECSLRGSLISMGDDEPTPSQVDDLPPVPQRKSTRTSRPSEKRKAVLNEKAELEMAKRARLAQSTELSLADLSGEYGSDPEEWNLSHQSESSESYDSDESVPIVVTNNNIPMSPSATTAARHMQDLPKNNQSSTEDDPSLLGSTLNVNDVGMALDAPLMSHCEIAALELRQVLMDGGATLETYDHVVNLINKYNHPTTGAFSASHSSLLPKRVCLLDRVKRRFPTAKPKVVPVPTTTGGAPSSTQCIVFPFLEQLKEMLLDEDLMGDKSNLSIDPDNPFDASAVPEDELGSEVTDSFWYEDTVELKMPKIDGTAMVIPILIYLDKTGVDNMQRYGLEPVIFTLGIFTAKARRQRKFWKCMGYLPDFDAHTSSAKKAKLRNSKKTSSERIRNYHACLKGIIQELIDAQSEGIMTWVRIGSELRYRKLFLCISNVLGDGKSSDYINLMKGGGGAFKPSRPCRFCTAQYDELDDAYCDCKRVKMKDLVNIANGLWDEEGTVDEKTRSILRRLSLHESFNAFRDCCFGANPFGIVQACSPDVMHMLELGMIAYVLSVLLCSMTNSIRVSMDDLVEHTFAIRSSVRTEHHRMNFTRGATAITLLTAKEWPGLLMAFLVVLKSSPDSFKKCFASVDMEEPPRPAHPVYPRHVATLDELMKFNRPHPTEDSTPEQEDGLPDDSDSQVEEEEEDVDSEAKQEDEDGGSSSPVDARDVGHPQEDEPDESDSEVEEEEEEVDSISPVLDAGAVDESGSVKKKKNKMTKTIPLPCSCEQFCTLLEDILIFHAWLLSPSTSARNENEQSMANIDAKIRDILFRIRHFAPRNEGNGYKLKRFHELTHILDAIELFGSPTTFDAGAGESFLKYFAKKAAKTSQMRSQDVFLKQVATRLHDDMACEKALAADRRRESVSMDSEAEESDTKPKVRRAIFEIEIQETGTGEEILLASWKSKVTYSHHDVSPLIVDYFQRNRNKLKAGTEFYTEIESGDQVKIRAHPRYDDNGGWYDFVQYRKTSENVPHLVGRVVAMYKSPSEEEYRLLIMTLKVTDNSSRLFKRCEVPIHNGRPSLKIISLDQVSEVVLGIPALQQPTGSHNQALQKELLSVGLVPRESYSSPLSFWIVQKRP